MIISKTELDMLIEHQPKPDSPVLSIYLDIDQSKAINLNRGFQVALKSMLQSLEGQLQTKKERLEFASDAETVRSLIEDYPPKGKSIVLFSDKSDGFFWQRTFHVPVRNDVRWSQDTIYVRPLLDVLDEYERYGVILTDKTSARLFTVFMGEIEEHQDAFAPAPIKHLVTTGTDHMRSQMNLQRKAEEHMKWHLKNVAEKVDTLARQHGFDRLMIGGPEPATSELKRLLPKALRSHLVTTLHLPMITNQKQILEVTLQVEQEIERDEETKMVGDLITVAAKRAGAVVGLDATLLTLQEGRIWKLVYAEGYAARGTQCTNCLAYLAELQGAYSYCGEKTKVVEDLLERISERVVDAGGKMELVRSAVAGRLKESGGIGAFLRF